MVNKKGKALRLQSNSFGTMANVQKHKKQKIEDKKSSKDLLKIETSPGDQHLRRLFLNTTNKTTVPLDGNSSVLNRVKSFLPLIKQANEFTQDAIKKGEKLDIEDIDESYTGDLIEMDLAFIDNNSDDSSDEEIQKAPTAENINILNTGKTKSKKILVSELDDQQT